MSTTSNVIAGVTLTAALVAGGIALSPEDAGVAPDGGVADGGQQPLEMRYFIATDGRDVVHCGEFDSIRQQMVSGQPIVRVLSSESERDAVAESLGLECPSKEPFNVGIAEDAGEVIVP